ncbi:MAG: hypothetical protein ACK5O7_01085 [Holosporales bacterium]
MKLFIARLLSGICLYILLGLSIESSVLSNTILAMGYRSLLIFSPLFCALFRSHSLSISFLFVLIAVGFYFFKMEIIGSVLAALGLSIGGFLIKKVAAESASSAGLNKIALSLANIVAGLSLTITDNNYSQGLLIAAAMMLISLVMIKAQKTEPVINESILPKGGLNSLWHQDLGWLLIGCSIGIRIFGLYAVLPWYLTHKLGDLPAWYGTLLMIYGALVILVQFPAVSKKMHVSLRTALFALGLSFIVIAVPELFSVELFWGGVLWVSLLAAEEMFAPFIDFHASSSNKLLLKEFSISLGGGLCVLMMRLIELPYLVAGSGLLLMCVGYLLVHDKTRQLNLKAVEK